MPQLPEPVALGDIDDIEGFVNATLNASGIELQAWERADLVADGLCILYELHSKFESHRAGYAQAGRFSGFAAWALPKKLATAWHKSRPEHRYCTDPETGKRYWQFFKASTSLDGVVEHPEFGRNDHAEAGLLDARYWVPVAPLAQAA